MNHIRMMFLIVCPDISQAEAAWNTEIKLNSAGSFFTSCYGCELNIGFGAVECRLSFAFDKRKATFY